MNNHAEIDRDMKIFGNLRYDKTAIVYVLLSSHAEQTLNSVCDRKGTKESQCMLLNTDNLKMSFISGCDALRDQGLSC